mgnify:CR=1 FL=1
MAKLDVFANNAIEEVAATRCASAFNVTVFVVSTPSETTDELGLMVTTVTGMGAPRVYSVTVGIVEPK